MTVTISSLPMFENGSLSQVTGGPMRPGGLDLTERMITHCDLSPGDIVVDVGCGTGSTIHYLLNVFSVYAIGVDRSNYLLQTGIASDPCLPMICALGESLPFLGGQMDAILAECSLSTMADMKSALTEFRRVLYPGGRLALTDIYARNPDGIPALRTLPISCGLRAAMGREELILQLQTHGFEIVVWEDHSETLKHLISQIILSCGSMREFWSQSEPGIDPMDIQAVASMARISYYLLVAKKI